MKEKIEDRTLKGKIRLNLTGRGKWEADKETLVAQIISVVNEYSRKGFRLTLRQLYYQLVSKDYIPNHDSVYKKLSSVLDDCRYSGVIDWNAIEDRGRVPFLTYYVEGIQHALNDTVSQYRLDRQEGQSNVVELWTEKDAISGILRRVTMKYHIRLVVNKGYTSSTAAYDAYSRFAEAMNEGKRVTILYFGDHDPSGLDMVRDIRDRCLNFLLNGSQIYSYSIEDYVEKWLKTFDQGEQWENEIAAEDYIRETYGPELCIQCYEGGDINTYFDANRAYIVEHFTIKHIGLTMEQIRLYNPPPNPAKITDSRAAGYIRKHGASSWEVDALRPEVLTAVVEQHVAENIDLEKYEEILTQEAEDKEVIKKIAEDFGEGGEGE